MFEKAFNILTVLHTGHLFLTLFSYYFSLNHSASLI